MGKNDRPRIKSDPENSLTPINEMALETSFAASTNDLEGYRPSSRTSNCTPVNHNHKHHQDVSLKESKMKKIFTMRGRAKSRMMTNSFYRKDGCRPFLSQRQVHSLTEGSNGGSKEDVNEVVDASIIDK